MAKVKWLDGMSVGVPEMDADHKQLFAALIAIQNALENGDKEEALALCRNLLVLAAEHNEREIEFLRRYAYPYIDNVLMVQENTVQGIQDLLSLFEKNCTISEITDKISNMQTAFIDYMLRGDINYKSFVQELHLDLD